MTFHLSPAPDVIICCPKHLITILYWRAGIGTISDYTALYTIFLCLRFRLELLSNNQSRTNNGNHRLQYNNNLHFWWLHYMLNYLYQFLRNPAPLLQLHKAALEPRIVNSIFNICHILHPSSFILDDLHGDQCCMQGYLNQMWFSLLNFLVENSRDQLKIQWCGWKTLLN